MSAATWEGLTPPYATIVVDPPWAYNTSRQLTTAKTKKPDAEANYSTLTTHEIIALPVVDLAADNAHLYLWITNPRLFGDSNCQCSTLDILDAWGFEYRTLLTWHKTGILGLGYYFRGDTEHVIFATRGRLPIAPDRRERNWFDAPRRGHSVKPPEFFDRVERVSPGPYVELFARQPRLGWDHWGYGYESDTARAASEGDTPT